MLAIEVGIFLFAAFLIVIFALIINPPNAIVNALGGKDRKKKKDGQSEG
jgi:hypothetical protein